MRGTAGAAGGGEPLAGTRLFTGDSPGQVIAAQRRAHVPMVHGVGDALNDLVRRATSSDPTRRPADAATFLAELQDAASDRYGPAWLKASSIAGAVAAALGTATLAASVGEPPSPVTVAAVQEARAVVAPSSGSVAKPRGRRWASKWAVASAAAVVVGVVSVATVAALSGGDPAASPAALDSKTIARSTSTDPPTTVGPTTVLTTVAPTTVAPTTTIRPAELAANRFAGTYQTTSVITDGNTSSPVGQTKTFELVLAADCTAADCGIQIGNSRSTIEGDTLHYAGTVTEPCQSDPAITVTDAWVTNLTATKRDGDQRVTTLEGSQTVTVSDLGGCVAEIDPVTTSWVATR